MRSTHCLPSYSFGGHEVFDAIPKFTKLYGKSVAIIGGETALSKALPHIRPVLDKAGIKVLDIIHFGGCLLYTSKPAIPSMKAPKPHASNNASTRVSDVTEESIVLIVSIAFVCTTKL